QGPRRHRARLRRPRALEHPDRPRLAARARPALAPVGGRTGSFEPLRVAARISSMPGKKILVVEDDPINQMILADFLAANGYQTVSASSGPEGIARFERDAPDLMLVDVQLPSKNGFELAREIKSRPNGKSTPILVMSAVYADQGHTADGYLA